MGIFGQNGILAALRELFNAAGNAKTTPYPVILAYR
jgi:hypothetical protein